MEHKGTVPFETDRLYLRAFTPDDAQAMFENWAGDEDNVRYLPWPAYRDAAQVREFLTAREEGYKEPTEYGWCIVLKETGEPIGDVSVVSMDEASDSCEIGWVISKRYWGAGLAPEALRRVMAYLFDEVGFNRIRACHDARNPASGRGLVKSGMRYEGTERQGRKDKYGNYKDVVHYAALRSDARRTDRLY